MAQTKGGSGEGRGGVRWMSGHDGVLMCWVKSRSIPGSITGWRVRIVTEAEKRKRSRWGWGGRDGDDGYV